MMLRKIISFILILFIALSCAAVVSAEQLDVDRSCSFSVTLTDGESLVSGARLAVYRVASANMDGEGNYVYFLTEEFDDLTVSLDDDLLAAMLDIYVSERDIPSAEIVTDTEGKASCEGLKAGLYFVKQTGKVDGFALCTPFVVTLPITVDGEIVYDVNASPKTDVEKLVPITVRKVWNTDSFTKGADSVTVQLLRDGAVIKTSVLGDENDWQVTYDDMPASDAYSITEINIPDGFTATYSKNGYEFTVTNTSSLIQTGQLVWPILVLASVGIAFITVGGILLLGKGKGENA